MVAMLAKQYGIPVVVCCETYKFSEGLMLDGFGKNELGEYHAIFLNALYFRANPFVMRMTSSSKFPNRANPMTFPPNGPLPDITTLIPDK